MYTTMTDDIVKQLSSPHVFSHQKQVRGRVDHLIPRHKIQNTVLQSDNVRVLK